MRQTRIFVRSTEAADDWYETVLGRVIRPLVQAWEPQLEWFWFSHYGSGLEDSQDCDLALLPADYLQPLQAGAAPGHRSVRFRFSMDPADLERFERQARQLIEIQGYRITDFRDYDAVADCGSTRFLAAESQSPGAAERRALLVTRFYMASSRLVLDALVGPDAAGRYRMEHNDDRLQNPAGSSFQSIHHVFCNITGTPTDVYVFRKQGLNLLGFGTYIYPPPPPPGGWDSSSPHPIWF